MKEQKKSGEKYLLEIKNKLINRCINIYLILSLAVFPLAMTKLHIRYTGNGEKIRSGGYITIFRDKYLFYCVITLGFLAVTFLLYFICRFILVNEFGKNRSLVTDETIVKKINWKNYIPQLAAAGFLLFSALSTIGSKYQYESFWGNEGRQCGLFLFILYVGVLLMIAAWWKPLPNKLDCFLVSAMAASIFGISQYLGYDWFHFRIVIDKPRDFISTFGNVNSYTAFIAVMLGVSTALYVSERKFLKALFYYVATCIGIFAIVTGRSDNAYLTLGALFGLLPFYAWKDRTGFYRYLILLATFVTEIKVIAVVGKTMSEKVAEIDSLFTSIAKYSGLTYLMIVLWLFVLVLYIEKWRKADHALACKPFPMWLRKVWAGLLLFILLIIGSVLFDINVMGNTEQYGAYLNYLKFDDNWGTHRGFIWRTVWELYERFPTWEKLFGHGPDTLGILYKSSEFDSISRGRYNEIIENAHNEYLHYLVTGGLTGMISYLALLFSSWYRMLRKGFDKPLVMACLFGTLCYCVQAVVNISAPIVTPIVWILLAMGLAGCREKS